MATQSSQLKQIYATPALRRCCGISQDMTSSSYARCQQLKRDTTQPWTGDIITTHATARALTSVRKHFGTAFPIFLQKHRDQTGHVTDPRPLLRTPSYLPTFSPQQHLLKYMRTQRVARNVGRVSHISRGRVTIFIIFPANILARNTLYRPSTWLDRTYARQHLSILMRNLPQRREQRKRRNAIPAWRRAARSIAMLLQ